MTDTELDRIWSRLDEHDKRIDAMETPRQQVVCIHCGKPVEERRRNWSQPTCYCCLPLPVRQVGDYLPDPVQWSKARPSSGGPCPCGCQESEAHPIGWCRQGQGIALPDPGFLSPDDKLRMIAGILSEMLPPSGIPGPAQRLLIRIREVIGE